MKWDKEIKPNNETEHDLEQALFLVIKVFSEVTFSRYIAETEAQKSRQVL